MGENLVIYVPEAVFFFSEWLLRRLRFSSFCFAGRRTSQLAWYNDSALGAGGRMRENKLLRAKEDG